MFFVDVNVKCDSCGAVETVTAEMLFGLKDATGCLSSDGVSIRHEDMCPVLWSYDPVAGESRCGECAGKG